MALNHFFTSNKKRTFLLIGIIIMSLGIISTVIFTYFADPNNPYNVTETTLLTQDDVSLRATVFIPENKTGCGIVNSHGFCGNKRWSQPLSIELVKRGFTVVTIDARGHGASDGFLDRDKLPYDILAAIDYLQNLGYINKIGLVGHSMGAGNSMVVASSYPDLINATVAIGATTTRYDYTDIPNLMMALGKYEQTNPPSELTDFLTAYTGNQSAEIGVLYGNFTLGNATKAVLSPYTEHLFEPYDPYIIEETIKWFELEFFGAVQSPIHITAIYLLSSISVATAGCLICIFIAIVYLGNYLWKNKQRTYSEIDFVKNQSVLKPVLYYILLVPTLGFLLILPTADLFSAIVPIDMFGTVFATLVFGKAIFIILVCYLFLSRTKGGKRSFHTISTAFKEMTSTNTGRSLIYGILVGIIVLACFPAILNWSFNTSYPTIREVGTIFIIAVLFFPFLLVKEFYFRTVQERLKASRELNSRFKEYFSMVGIGFLMDLTIPIILMILTWQTPLGAIAFVLFPTSIFAFCRHVIVPWVYMHSGRNIVGSAAFYSIMWAWMIICFFPFGIGASISVL
jgi:pimeloyl-ACP methyl ester carboxylesterase